MRFHGRPFDDSRDEERQLFCLVLFDVYTRGRVSYVLADIVFRSATGIAPHRPQSRQQERNDWITFHFCGYTNEVQCRSQMFWSAPVDFGVILLRYSAMEDVPHANRLPGPVEHIRRFFDWVTTRSFVFSAQLFTARTFSDLAIRKKTIDTIKYALVILLLLLLKLPLTDFSCFLCNFDTLVSISF